MTDRRPLGTGPTRPAAETNTELPPAPRAQLAAERLPVIQAAAEPRPTPAVGRRVLGAGPTER
ncbi:hypothetical protein ACIP29_37285 [Streptomyces coelicoflavus]|uniref:hypothetical protein n=1 Tax=Streptomyces coelicoflavus TaxID=285562 RepID=UPI0038090180